MLPGAIAQQACLFVVVIKVALHVERSVDDPGYVEFYLNVVNFPSIAAIMFDEIL
jgi:hypothetical protein